VFTHDSIGLGEDGPTHQPIEHLSALRAIPGLVVLRPADANEVSESWRVALRHEGPVALALTRQKLPWIDRSLYGSARGVEQGAYVLADAVSGPPQVTLIGSGSEVQLAIAARETLAAQGVRARVVSMPSHELFAAQDERYRDDVLPPEVPRVAVEAAHPMSWYRWLGGRDAVVGIDHFGASAPAERLFTEFGITAQRVVEAALSVMQK
jgi:transketolase